MLFVAMNVALGIMGRTSLEPSGKLKACQLFSFVVGLGREENETLPGIAYNVAAGGNSTRTETYKMKELFSHRIGCKQVSMRASSRNR